MLAAGYTDAELPVSWYSPVRKGSEQPEPTGDALKSTEPTELNLKGDEPLTPATPRIPAPREGLPHRPSIQDQLSSGQDKTALLTELQDGSGRFTTNELNLLGSQGIIRGQDGIWVHIEKERARVQKKRSPLKE